MKIANAGIVAFVNGCTTAVVQVDVPITGLSAAPHGFTLTLSSDIQDRALSNAAAGLWPGFVRETVFAGTRWRAGVLVAASQQPGRLQA